MTQLLKRWEEGTFDLLGQEIRLKVKAPCFDEAPDFLRKMMVFGRAAQQAKAASVVGEGVEDMFSAIDTKWTRDVFAKCVKPVEAILVEDDGPEAKPIQTGADLYEVANWTLVLQVLHRIQRLVMLTADEGKASSSPSTSGVGTGMVAPDSGVSPATITEPADGPAR